MKLKIPLNKKKNEKLIDNIIKNINSKNTNNDLDFFHNKLLNNIIEISNHNYYLLLSNNKRQKGKNDHFKFASSLRKINSAIMRNLRSQKNIIKNESNSSNRAIKSNNVFIKNKNKIDSHFSNGNDTSYKLHNKTINEDSGIIRSSMYNFPHNINTIKKSSNCKIFSKVNDLQMKEDEKCNKITKYVHILEKKMKEKLMRITNFDDVNVCYRRIKINNFPKNLSSTINMPNNIYLEINKLYKLNKCIKNEKNDEQKSDICMSNTYYKHLSSKNNSISRTSSSSIEYLTKNLYKLSQYIKEEVKNYFIKNKFSSIKDYFNDWICQKRKYDYKNKNELFLDCDNIYNYLKNKIGLNISKDDICKIFGCETYFDIENFKNYFFEENSGKKCFIITKDCLLKNTKIDFDNKNNNNNFSLSPSSSYFIKNKEKEFTYKYDLFFNALIDQRSIILDKICDYRMGFNKMEYEYSDFNNLINSLNLDKRIYNQKIIKTIFSKYQNKNKKVNIKYFVNILYGNENTRKEYSYENKKLNKNNKNKAKNIYDKYKFDRNNKNNSMGKKTFNNNIISPSNLCNNNDKKDFSQNVDNNQINNNKYTEESSDYNVIRPKKKFMKKKIEKNKKVKKKPFSPTFKIKIKLNHSAGSEQLNKVEKLSESKSRKKITKNNNNNNCNKSLNSMSSVFSSNKDDLIQAKEKSVKKINKYTDKNKIEKTIKSCNSFKAIRLSSKYKLNKDKEKDKEMTNEKNSNKKIQCIDYRPISSYFNRKNSVNNNNNKDFFNIMNFKMSKIFEQPRIQYLNSDIIDLI